MSALWKIIRFLVVSLLILTVGIPAILYLLLWITPVRDEIRKIAVEELSNLLGTEVEIGSVEIEPFSRLNIDDVAVNDSLGRTILAVKRLGGGVSVVKTLTAKRPIISDVEIIQPQLHLWRDSASAPLNIDPILARLKSDNNDNGPKKFALSLLTAVVRQGRFTYVVGTSESDSLRFSPSHIDISDINADINLPRLSNKRIIINLKRLSATERSGLRLENLRASVNYTDTALTVTGLELALPASRLRLSDINVAYDSADKIAEAIVNDVHSVSLLKGSKINLSDFAPFVPNLAALDTPFDIELNASGNAHRVRLHNLRIESPTTMLTTRAEASVASRIDSISGLVNPLKFKSQGSDVLKTICAFSTPSTKLSDLITRLGAIEIKADLQLQTGGLLKVDAEAATELGSVDINAETSPINNLNRAKGHLKADNLSLGAIIGNPDFGEADFSLELNATSRDIATAALQIDNMAFRGVRYTDIAVDAALDGEQLDITLETDNEPLSLFAEARALLTKGGNPDLKLNATVNRFRPDEMNLWGKYPGYGFSAEIDADLTNVSAFNTEGMLSVNNLIFANTLSGDSLQLAPLTVDSRRSSDGNSRITLSSDVAEAEISGKINAAVLQQQIQAMMAGEEAAGDNDFTLKVRILENPDIFNIISLPIRPIYTATISGAVRPSSAWLSIDAPYLQKGDKLIKRTRVDAQLGARSSLLASTLFPTADGDMRLRLSALLETLSHATLDCNWEIDRKRAFKGSLGIDADIVHTSEGFEAVAAEIRPSDLVFNDTAWHVAPARIYATKDLITVDNLDISRSGQSVKINGTASADSLDRLLVDLHNIDVDYIFETLNISDKIIFGGQATGVVTASSLLTKTPVLHTDNLRVHNFSYCHGVFGDADITALWDNTDKAICLHADVAQHNGGLTIVDGRIGPTSPGLLDFTFKADRAPLGFLKQMLSAFASDVSGTATGTVKLYGTLKEVEMTGNARAHDFGLRLAATNCEYFTSDTVVITPGRINLENVTIRDFRGNTARLNGELRHRFLKEPEFEFNVTGARNLLVYDVNRPLDGQNWYGRIFGSGSASITGDPRQVSVGADITTSPGSEFSFMLSDKQEAGEYSFITFRDPSQTKAANATALRPGSRELDNIMESRVKQMATASSSADFNMNLNVGVTPAARMNLIMDPASGDKITAYGSGTPNILYSSRNDEFLIYGDYRIERGDYNFSLQDIILRNFSIERGSSVNFNGDIDNITADISAIYALKANLSDLDQSFLTDKEVGRTSVTVNAILKVTGNIYSPEIKFDLAFPTLPSDVSNKVHAIVSTDEMMNQQIIYLLALNRFYTPDYMAAASNAGPGSELVSVASSTISSQLSNILGNLSDKFSVAPNLRSDAGDFSDVEFDVALTSTLLNNRLLLNGNLGYRDQTLNNNQFIGDFDLEYLLNRGGNWRLKAYNHFNDRNLYVKTAMTTQGIGLVFKHDFDNLWRRRSKVSETRSTDDAKP